MNPNDPDLLPLRDSGQVPVGTGPAAKPPRNWKRILLLFGVLCVLLAGIVLGWMWWSGRDSGSTPSRSAGDATEETPAESEETAAEDDCEGLATHEDPALDIGFCYPLDWDDVTKTDAKFVPADTGSRWVLSFSDKQNVSVGLVSSDWSTGVPRDGTCADPARQTLPPFAPFSATWVTDTFGGSEIASASRGIEVLADKYLIQEQVDNLLSNGVCLEGYAVLEAGSTYAHAATTYTAEFSDAIATPEAHVATPETLVPVAERAAFTAFVKSIHAL